MGIPGEGGLQFVGRVGTGFTEKELAKLKKLLAPLHTDESPFNARLSGAMPGCDVRAAGAGGGGPLQRMDRRRPAAPAQLAGSAAGQTADEVVRERAVARIGTYVSRFVVSRTDGG